MNYPGEEFRNMISNFRSNELHTLLGTFGRNKGGRKSELKERAIELLRNKPVGFNIQAYCAKIVEIYRSMTHELPNSTEYRNMIMHGQRQMGSMNVSPNQQQRSYQPPQYPQQPMQITRGTLPQVMPQMQRGIYGNSNVPGNSGNSSFQYNYQQPGTRPIVAMQPGIGVPDQMGGYDMNNPINNNFVASPQSLANVKFKKLPFFEIIDEILKPTILSGHDKCTLSSIVRGMREYQYKLTMLRDQVSHITLNRNLNCGKNEYLYQVQIRICLIDPKVPLESPMEVSDFLPLALNIRVCNKACALPPTAPNTRPGAEARRTPRTINITPSLKLSPKMINTITLNWLPDGKIYTWGMYLVKKLSSEFLLQKLKDKGARSSDETKNNIIRKLADVDPDLATTSYRFSLVCPLGKMRMQIPAKSINCGHLQCFDASIFILMNEKKPTWSCPTCSKPCLYDDIRIESYFLDIVSSPSLPDSCKEIEILADGTWKVFEDQEQNTNTESAADNTLNPTDSVNLDDSDDEENTNNNSKNENENASEQMEVDKQQSKPESKPESNPESSKESSDGLKSSFIDLTISDDDEEQTNTKEKQENEAQAVDAIQSVTTTVDLKPQAQVQPQQAVTSSEQEGVIEIDSPSPPPETLTS